MMRATIWKDPARLSIRHSQAFERAPSSFPPNRPRSARKISSVPQDPVARSPNQERGDERRVPFRSSPAGGWGERTHPSRAFGPKHPARGLPPRHWTDSQRPSSNGARNLTPGSRSSTLRDGDGRGARGGDADSGRDRSTSVSRDGSGQGSSVARSQLGLFSAAGLTRPAPERRSQDDHGPSDPFSRLLEATSPLPSAVKTAPGWGLLARRSPKFSPDRRRPEPLSSLADSIVHEPAARPTRDGRRSSDFWQQTRTRVAALKPGQQTTSDEDKEFFSRFEGRLVDKRAEADLSAPRTPDPETWTPRNTKEGFNHTLVERGRTPLSRQPTRTSTRATARREDRWDRLDKPRSKPKPRRQDRAGEQDDEEEYDEASEERIQQRRKRKMEAKKQKEAELAGATPIHLPQHISVANLGLALGTRVEVFLKELAELGFEDITQDSIMTGETAALVAQEYGFEPTVDNGELVDLKPRSQPKDASELPPRPPIVTIMGHVDHGKTTMLDWLRKSSVAAQEHGGITQHIGAFSVSLSSGKVITFLDTPGHAAFLTMRERGASVTDIVVLVVAADDSVKPQTIEALRHARSAKVPIIVAINKIDKDEARVEHVKADLSRHGVEIEEYGGDVQVVCVSGKTGQGMADLEESILTLSEILDVRAETDGMAEGWVLESSIKPIGRVATVLVKRGTLRRGDLIVAGTSWARIRVLRNEAGVEIDEARPGSPVEILGWKDAPTAGDQMLQAPDEGRAKLAIRYREEMKEREKTASEVTMQLKMEREKAALGALGEGDNSSAVGSEAEGTKVVNFIIKGDVTGSVEAVNAAVMGIGNNEVRPHVLRTAPGQISESDVELAATCDSSIINFANPISGTVRRMADNSGVTILDHTVIYHVVDEVKSILSKMLPPNISTRVIGEAEVLQVFPINIRGRIYRNVAGCRVRNGQVTRASKYRVLRRGETVFDGKLESLKQGKKDVAEMKKGTECGLSFEGWQDMREGDHIQAYEEVRESRQL